MRRCPTCGGRYRGEPEACPIDGAALVDVPDGLIGRLVGGRYRVLERIGSGGMGTVYRARHEVLERDVAVKVLAPDMALDTTYRTRFLREARAASRVRHEHIVDVNDFGEADEGLVYIVMEYLDGVSLGSLLDRSALPLVRALRIALQMASALGRAHELDVVHRDIKPDNVHLLDRQGADFVKILDFGLAHVKGDTRLTATGTVFGTPRYIAPEQASGMRATPATDLYAFGCVLFEMIAGRPPFEGPSTVLVLKHIREPAPALASLVPDVPPALDGLVASLLRKEPETRPQSAYDVARALDALLAQHSSRGSVGGAETQEAPRAPAHSWAQRRDSSEADQWIRRVAALQQAERRVYRQGAPPWLRTAIEDLSSRAAQLASIQAEHARCLERVSQIEQELRETQLRIGHALDTLARDAAQVAAQLRDAEAPLAEARQRRDTESANLAVCWQGLGAPPPDPTLRREQVMQALLVGEAAGRWLDADRQVDQRERDLGPLLRQREELRFQITQLKGRLGSVGADMEYEIHKGKDEAEALERDIRRAVESLAAQADPVMQHLLAFPELRPMLLAVPDGDAGDRAGA
jgi:eukaryotic-like serine/threonine-protein kinase